MKLEIFPFLGTKKADFPFLGTKKEDFTFLGGKNPFLVEKNCSVRPRKRFLPYECTAWLAEAEVGPMVTNTVAAFLVYPVYLVYYCKAAA